MSFPGPRTRQFSCQICLLWCWYLYSISGKAFEVPGWPVRLRCGDTIVNGREELEWRSTHPEHRLLAWGAYVDGVLTNVSYYDRLANGRAELSSDGSLTIHSYEDGEHGRYICHSEYREAVTYLYTFSMYSLWSFYAWLIKLSILRNACKSSHIVTTYR